MSKLIDGDQYVKLVRSYYAYLENEFNMTQAESTINGSYYYIVHYKDNQKVIFIYYENIERYF